MGLFDPEPIDYERLVRIINEHMEAFVQAEVAHQIEQKLKDWEPTQNIRLTVAVETPDKK